MKFIYFVLIIVMLPSVMGYVNNYTTDTGKVYIVYNESQFEPVRDYILQNSTVCNLGRCNKTFCNYTRHLFLGCHLYENSSTKCHTVEQNMMNYTGWSFYFDGNSQYINDSEAMVMRPNSTSYTMNNVYFGGQHNNTLSTFTFTGFTEKSMDGNCKSSGVGYHNLGNAIYPNLARKLGYEENSTVNKEFLDGVAFQFIPDNLTTGLTENPNSNPANNMFSNASMNYSIFLNSKWSMQLYNTSGILKTSISNFNYINSSIVYSTYESSYAVEGFFVEDSGHVIVNRKKTDICFVTTNTLIDRTTFRESYFTCGVNLLFAFSSRANLNLIDSESDIYVSDGYLSKMETNVSNTINYFPQNSSGENIVVNYSLTDKFGKKYQTYSNLISLLVLTKRYEYNYPESTIATDYNPFILNLTNKTLDIDYSNFSVNITKKNSGFIPLQAKIINQSNVTNATNVYNNQPIEYRSNQSGRGLDLMFIVMIGIAIIFVALGLIIREHTELALVGFTFLFLIAVSMLTVGLTYKVGENVSVSYTYQNESIGQINTTNIESVDVYANYPANSGIYHTFAYYLAVVSALGFSILLFSLRRKKQ